LKGSLFRRKGLLGAKDFIMPLYRLCSLAGLALAASAEAQELALQRDCAGLSADSFEAVILGCEITALISSSDVVVDELPEEAPWNSVNLDRQPAGSGNGRPTPPILEAREARLPANLSASGSEIRHLDITGSTVELSAPSDETSVSSRGSGAIAGVSGPVTDADDQVERLIVIPDQQRPPPGSCRIWFPDQHPGFQRPPTSCDVELPDGAVLIVG
jgi:hypothetical protein